VDGKVVLYADTMTDSMREAVGVTQRRRARQTAYNAEHGIDPQTIRKAVTDILERLRRQDGVGRAGRSRSDVRRGRAGRVVRTRVAVGGGGWAPGGTAGADDRATDLAELGELASQIETEMKAAAAELRFEEAALLRDEMMAIRGTLAEATGD
jgi:excinuclease ABC subunit B